MVKDNEDDDVGSNIGRLAKTIVKDCKDIDTETIYARAMTLQATSRGTDTENLLAHELAPYPTSMFDVDGHMREAKTKSMLKNTLC